MNNEDDPLLENGNLEISEDPREPSKDAKPVFRKYFTRHAKSFPELYQNDISIHSSYSDLKKLPYHLICRHRVQRLKRQIFHQLNREVTHFAMMQMFALDSVRIDRAFSIGMSPKLLIVPDPLTEKERRRLNKLLREP